MAVWEQQVGRPVPAGFHIKRAHPNRRREFPWGIPRPYARPQPTFLGATTATDDAANGLLAVILPKREYIAAVLREEYRPHGIPPRGKGWDKGAKETLRARGIDTSRAEYFHAVAINKRLAKAIAGRSQP
jgi:hypothetical protein